jgi:hypothetical protein
LSATDHGARALNQILAAICELDSQRERVEAELKSIKARLDELKEAATDSIKASGLDGIKAGGRTWWLQDVPHVSVPADNRKEVLRIAGELGIRDEIETVATTTLKSILAEQAKEKTSLPLNDEGMPSIVAGTPFAGLVGEYVETALRSRRV